MKKILFSLLLVAAMSANAQTFNEEDLVGTWTMTGFSYPPGKILNIESITLGIGVYEVWEKELFVASGLIKNMKYISPYNNRQYTENSMISDYFISNNNKLHIIAGNYALHFIIEELSASSLKVKTFDGQNYTFEKDNSSTDVKPMTITRSADDSIYNLNGQKVEDVTTDGVYIQNGQKKVVKK